jgi:hypothetical protein
VPQTNPITRRLDRLSMQWLQFVDDAPARVLRWRVRPDEARMVETFLGVENSEGGQMPALFVRLVVPFQAAHTYAFAVRDELLAQIDREAEEDDTLAGFHPPRPRADDHGLVGLRDLSVALVDHVRARGVELDQLVLAILPPSVVDIAGFATFVARLAEALVATDVRAIVLDDRDAPRLDPAVDLAPGRIHTEVADIDMPGAMLEVSARAGGLEEPHGRFRHAYTKMLLAVADRDLDAAQVRATEASAVAEPQGWWHLVVAVRFCVGTGFLDAERPAEAIRWFRAAEARLDAPRSETGSDDDAALVLGLRLKCRLGMAAACYFAQAFGRAAEAYGAAAEIAIELKDLLAEIDARRMQSHCLERDGRIDEAWDAGVAGLGVGAKIPAADRRTSTLPHLGEAMLGLTKRSRLAHARRPIEAQMRQLLGDGWRPEARAVGT